ncbi:glycosyltransferase [Paraburkholderia sp. ZP32-5]|uniref:glycosyltransferase n=1 Tax=Paraburkholderia sp. ZP32-5 TaxID=2883245 RepID=UPI001F43A6FD|nr:glycosyltransferase [Paraburkholderia sp. ZP32-5]
MKVAIVHDWLVAPGGAEKVLEQIIECFPDADLFSLVDFLEDRALLANKAVTTSFIQRLPFARSRYRMYLPLMPLAVAQFDLSSYDLIITNSSSIAKGVPVGPDQKHISYVHAPMSYVGDLQHQYLREANLLRGPKSWAARALFHYLRGWDADATNGVDHLIANSQSVARRVMKAYRRDAAVVPPPLDVDRFELRVCKEDFYLAVSRMEPHERIDLIVDAFNATPQRKLIVIGDGPRMAAIRAKAAANVTILGAQPRDVLKDYLQRARAFVFAAEEDFSIVPLEAQACGTPVIAFGRGGVLETVVPVGDRQPTGVFFARQTAVALLEAIDRFERLQKYITAAACRANAERFSAAVFRRAFMAEVTRAICATDLPERIAAMGRGDHELAAQHGSPGEAPPKRD